jgi:hypothetical protein
MLEVWRQTDADVGSAAWFRIIEQAGPELTWEWLMVESTKSYAELFSDELRAACTRHRRRTRATRPG